MLEDQYRGLSVLSGLSGDLQSGAGEDEVLDALLARLLTLPAVLGAAVYGFRTGSFLRGAGVCETWMDEDPTGSAEVAIARVVESGEPEVLRGWPGSDGDPGQAYTAALPIFRGDSIQGVLLVVGSSRDPFAVLDTPFLLALGHQVGAALANADMYQKLEDRKAELERLATRMVHHQEEERRRLSRELHDESAQVFAAVKLQLGMARESAAEEQRPALDRAMDLVGSGIRSIRAVARNLRPSLLDDLGLLPALRALGGDFSGKMGIPVTINAPESIPVLSAGAELALFRALQEGLSNVARHSEASAVEVVLSHDGTRLTLTVSDNGRGPPAADFDTLADGRMGLAGMRERALALGGSVDLAAREEGGTVLSVRIPVADPDFRSGSEPARSQRGVDEQETMG